MFCAPRTLSGGNAENSPTQFARVKREFADNKRRKGHNHISNNILTIIFTIICLIKE